MKRLLILTALAAMTVGLAGCGRNWGQWWNRGGWCAPAQQPHTNYMPYAPVEVYEDGAVTVPGPATLPPLPGPAR